MRSASGVFVLTLASVLFAAALAPAALAQTKTRPGKKLRVKIGSQPEQAAIYIDSKDDGIQGYTPATMMLPRGTYTIILELPGFRTVQKEISVTASQAFVFTLERPAKPAVLDVRATPGDAATGGQLYVDGAPVGTVPARVELSAGHHVVEVKKSGFIDYKSEVDLIAGDDRALAVDLAAAAAAVKKGAVLVTADVAGGDVYVDGERRDSAPALVSDLAEGPHVIEVRQGSAPPWKQTVQVQAGKQVKVQAQLQQQTGTLRVLSTTPDATVLVDGEDKGPANREIELKPGQHIIEVRAKGFQSQIVEQSVVAGEQRLAKVDLQPQVEKQVTARLRIIAPVADADVILDGAAAGKVPFDRSDLAPGKHFVTVHKSGYADWKREIELDPARPETLTADLAATATLKVLCNVAGANVALDGQSVGKTPLTLDAVAAGDHVIEVSHSAYTGAKQSVHVEGGEQKVLSADLAFAGGGPGSAELQRTRRQMASFSAVTLEPGRFTGDLFVGWVPFFGGRLTVGALRAGAFGIDGGVELRTTGYLTEGLAHAKLQFLNAAPVAVAVDTTIGGGGGPHKRNDFLWEIGVPVTILFGDLVRFTAHPYLQVYSDRNCPSVSDLKDDDTQNGTQMGPPNMRTPVLGSGPLYKSDEEPTCKKNDFNNDYAAAETAQLGATYNFKTFGQVDPRARFSGVRLMLQAVLELAISDNTNVVLLIEGDPIGERQALTSKFSAGFYDTDTQFYARLGLTFKF